MVFWIHPLFVGASHQPDKILAQPMLVCSLQDAVNIWIKLEKMWKSDWIFVPYICVGVNRPLGLRLIVYPTYASKGKHLGNLFENSHWNSILSLFLPYIRRVMLLCYSEFNHCFCISFVLQVTVIICFNIDGKWHRIAESKQKHIL